MYTNILLRDYTLKFYILIINILIIIIIVRNGALGMKVSAGCFQTCFIVLPACRDVYNCFLEFFMSFFMLSFGRFVVFVFLLVYFVFAFFCSAFPKVF